MDAVVIFEEDTIDLIRVLKPDVLVKGADYTVDEVVGAEDVKSWGGEVVLVELLDGHSDGDDPTPWKVMRDADLYALGFDDTDARGAWRLHISSSPPQPRGDLSYKLRKCEIALQDAEQSSENTIYL